ncbi:MAG: M24 family metallopeptidase, partial [Candidatus Zixiibacteriota bacterium]
MGIDLVQAKIEQTIEILNELDIDLWLIFCRESSMMADPVMDLVVGHQVVWQSAFFITKDGDTLALVGNYDAANFKKSRRYLDVQPYVQDCGKEIRRAIKKFNPRKIALNYSVNDNAADGLTHGMFLLLMEYLKGTPYVERIVSSEEIISLLRGRKIMQEIEQIASAALMATECWRESIEQIRVNMTEIDIARLIDYNLRRMGTVNSFDTIVNAGAKSSPGHGSPTEAVLLPGDLLHIDFGARVNGFCSDLQRLAYFRRENESRPPAKLIKAFNKVKNIIEETAKLYRPGV